VGDRASDAIAEGSFILVFPDNPEDVNSKFLRNVGKHLSDGIMTVSFIAPDLRGSEMYLTNGPSEGTHLGRIFKFSGAFNLYKKHKPLFTLHKNSLEQNFINYSRRCVGDMIFQRKS
jgi:hypothetical protein